MKKGWKMYVVFIILFLILILFLLLVIRRFDRNELDDVHPDFNCSSELIEKSDVLWVVPLYNNKSIADDQEWCHYVLSLNKTLGLHGVYHSYNEFYTERDADYVLSGMQAFERCFGFKPKIFKAPQLAFNSENNRIMKNDGLEVFGKVNQLIHKVYHCNDSGRFSNEFIDWF